MEIIFENYFKKILKNLPSVGSSTQKFIEIFYHKFLNLCFIFLYFYFNDHIKCNLIRYSRWKLFLKIIFEKYNSLYAIVF